MMQREETGAAEAVDTAAATLDAIDAEKSSGGKWKIGFSNYSAGNSWRQQMEAEFESEAEKLKEAGIISDYAMLNADNDQSKQISDINDLITMGCDAIVVTAITEDGLNDVLEEAEDEGIVVVNFDNNVSSDKITSKIKVSDYDFGFSAQENGLANSWKQERRLFSWTEQQEPPQIPIVLKGYDRWPEVHLSGC